jgi:hypothetical protein
VNVSRIFLGLSALIWLPYGIYCFLAPGALAGIAGVTSSSVTGSIELRAMYGGLQAAIGVLAGAALLRPSLERPALLALAFLCGGLFTARLLGALVESEFSAYTLGGMALEIVSCTLAARLAAATSAPAPA